jgi:membrane AbrB-like protein
MPNPALLGAMFATGALSVFGHYPPLIVWPVSFLANMTIGVMVARQIDRNVLRRLKALLRPVVAQTAGMLLLSLLCGYVMRFMSVQAGAEVPLTTALISGAAGGITEMSAFGMSVDADVAVIVFIQLFRIVIFLALVPYISKIGDQGRFVRIEASDAAIAPFRKRDYAVMLCAALLGASLAYRFRLPAGAMLGAIAACGAYAISVGRRYAYDHRIRWAAQICLGLAMGQRITPKIVSHLGALILPAIAVTAVMLAGSLALAFLLRKTTGWDVTTCLLCAAPAGLSQITVYAEEVGADSLTATVFHTARVVGIVAIYPWIVIPLSS